ncbi:hypothetical protein CAS74_001879 [Pichia kudriavzevii]|uniref:Uncharacterized protein n=1 Tax=Pichia kudriavzevii TaxID=4909 RepID=A0A1Z8JSJ0_PICKU|nr:hypothetical protein CAS74_001877 [Pichia kudriavzevii]OUT23557.1 hypothetical protein CAS74_001879 [Pichia kudriavzevii]
MKRKKLEHKGQQSHNPKLNPEKAAETPSFDAKHKGKRLDVAEVTAAKGRVM